MRYRRVAARRRASVRPMTRSSWSRDRIRLIDFGARLLFLEWSGSRVGAGTRSNSLPLKFFFHSIVWRSAGCSTIPPSNQVIPAIIDVTPASRVGVRVFRLDGRVV